MLPKIYKFLNLQTIKVIIFKFWYQCQNQNKNHIQNQNYIEFKYANIYDIYTYKSKFISL